MKRLFLLLATLLLALPLQAAPLFYTTVYDETGSGPGNILQVDASGNATIWNTGLTFEDPEGIAVDSHGSVFVNDGANIYKITSAGQGTLFATKPDDFYAYGLTIDSANNVYAVGADGNSYAIYKFDPSGNRSLLATLPGGAFVSLVWRPDGYLYATEPFSGSVLRIDSAGNITLFASVDGAYALTFDNLGNLLVGNSDFDGLISKVSPDGSTVTPLILNDVGLARGLGVDSAGNIYGATQLCDCGSQNYLTITAPGSDTATAFTLLDETQRGNFIAMAPTPEPSTYLLLGLGLLAMILWRGRQRRI